LVLEEPGRTGKDLYSIDRSVVVQARLARRIPPSMDWLVEKEMMQMSGKLQSDFRWTKEAKVGYAVLSFYQFGRIRSLIAEVARR